MLSPEEVIFDHVEVLIIWRAVTDYLVRLQHLRLILICGSGVDHIIDSRDLPHGIPLVRLVDPFLRNRVANYVLAHVCQHFFPAIRLDSQTQDPGEALKSTKKPQVGIMGLGLIGAFVAAKFLDMGFDVYGWTRTSHPRGIENVHVGSDELGDFARASEVLVCQLPLTSATAGILNQHLFGLLPEGAYLVNVGRGAHLVEADLLLALDTGKLAGAGLDVFLVEPLPAGHPFHVHPKITVTPYIAGYVGYETQAA